MIVANQDCPSDVGLPRLAGTLDEAFLIDVGLDGLSSAAGAALLAYLREVLPPSIERLLVRSLTPDQRTVWDQLAQIGDEQLIAEFLVNDVADHSPIVQRILDDLRVTVRSAAPALLATNGTATSGPA